MAESGGAALARKRIASAYGDNEGTDGQFLDSQQMQQIGLDLVVADLIGRAVVESGQSPQPNARRSPAC